MSNNYIIPIAPNTQAYLTARRDVSQDKFDVVDYVFQYANAAPFPSAWGYWKLEETSGSRADSSGNNRSLLEIDNPVTYTADGKINNAAKFPGTDGTLQNLAAAATPAVNTNWVMSLWIRIHRVATGSCEGYYEINGGAGQVSGGYGLNSGQTNGFFYLSAPSSQYVETGNTLTPDVWHFITCGHDGTQLYIEVDGSLVDSDVGANTASGDPGGSFNFGGIYPDNKMTIEIDELGLWLDTNSLTPAQRAQLYNSGSGWSPY